MSTGSVIRLPCYQSDFLISSQSVPPILLTSYNSRTVQWLIHVSKWHFATHRSGQHCWRHPKTGTSHPLFLRRPSSWFTHGLNFTSLIQTIHCLRSNALSCESSCTYPTDVFRCIDASVMYCSHINCWNYQANASRFVCRNKTNSLSRVIWGVIFG